MAVNILDDINEISSDGPSGVLKYRSKSSGSRIFFLFCKRLIRAVLNKKQKEKSAC